MRADRVEQLFLRPRAGRVEVLLVLEDPAGARSRETLVTPASANEAAVRFVARRLAERGIGPALRTRLRLERGSETSDDPRLLALFLRELHDASKEPTTWD
jgi:hypothetical protein